jgi:hypothetical protein
METMASVVDLTRFTASTIDRRCAFRHVRVPSCARSVGDYSFLVQKTYWPIRGRRVQRASFLVQQDQPRRSPCPGYTPSLRHLVNRLCRRGTRVFTLDSAQIRPEIPSGSGVTSPRDAILLVAAKSSSWVTRSSSLHSMVSLGWEFPRVAVVLVVPTPWEQSCDDIGEQPWLHVCSQWRASGLSFFVTSW